MTPEVRELVEAIHHLSEVSELIVVKMSASELLALQRAWKKVDSSIAAVEALEDPATAHKAAIDRRVAEDGGRMSENVGDNQ